MTMPDAFNKAQEAAYQWRRPSWVVFDWLMSTLVVFVGPHKEYLMETEPRRYTPVDIVLPDGSVERML